MITTASILAKTIDNGGDDNEEDGDDDDDCFNANGEDDDVL